MPFSKSFIYLVFIMIKQINKNMKQEKKTKNNSKQKTKERKKRLHFM